MKRTVDAKYHREFIGFVIQKHREEIRELKQSHTQYLRELYEVILNFTSEAAREHFQLFIRDDSNEFYDELRSRVEALIKSTAPLNPDAHPYDRRAMCPLCGSETTSRYLEGFAYPEGLRRHLLTGGNVTRCMVTQLLVTINLNHRADISTDIAASSG